VQKAIIQHGDKFLIIRRSSLTPVYPNMWDFPGGKWEKGESLRAGIIREVKEETSLKIEPLKIVAKYDIHYSNELNIHFNIYSIKEYSGKVNLSHEHTAFKWATRKQILRHKTEPYLRLLIQENRI